VAAVQRSVALPQHVYSVGQVPWNPSLSTLRAAQVLPVTIFDDVCVSVSGDGWA
jgi:hypothetical protein